MKQLTDMTQDNIPSTNDVLLGRGHFANKWKGNDFFRKLVHSFKHEYITTSNECKRQIAKAIVDIIYGLPGRFLKQDNKTKYWIEVEEKDAIKKTRQALREGNSIRKRNFSEKDSISQRRQAFHEGDSVCTMRERSLHTIDDLDNESSTSSPTLVSENSVDEATFLKDVSSILLESNVVNSSKRRRIDEQIVRNEGCNVYHPEFQSELQVGNSIVQNNTLFEQDPLAEFITWMNSPIPEKYLSNIAS